MPQDFSKIEERLERLFNRPANGPKSLNSDKGDNTLPEQGKGIIGPAEPPRNDYKSYTENTIAAAELQKEILDGLDTGKDIYSLFLQAAKAIALMTNTELFYTEAEQRLKAIYGRGLMEPAPLEMARADVEKRLQMLRKAESRETDTRERQRIRRAVLKHEEQLASLKRESRTA